MGNVGVVVVVGGGAGVGGEPAGAPMGPIVVWPRAIIYTYH